MTQFYVKKKNGEAGPFSEAQLRTMLSSGQLKAQHQVRRGDSGGWQRVGSFNELSVGDSREPGPLAHSARDLESTTNSGDFVYRDEPPLAQDPLYETAAPDTDETPGHPASEFSRDRDRVSTESPVLIAQSKTSSNSKADSNRRILLIRGFRRCVHGRSGRDGNSHSRSCLHVGKSTGHLGLIAP